MPLTAMIYWESVGTLEKIPVLGPGGGGKQGSDCEVLDSEGVSLGCPALCPAAHNVGGVRGDAECVSPAT